LTEILPKQHTADECQNSYTQSPWSVVHFLQKVTQNQHIRRCFRRRKHEKTRTEKSGCDYFVKQSSMGPIFEKSYEDFMILSYHKFVITVD